MVLASIENAVADDLRATVARLSTRACRLDDEQRNELRERVCAFVDARKRDGLSPEHLIIEVRSIAGKTGFADSPANDVVSWCIERYFQTD